MKREKSVSVRVNSELYQKFLETLSKYTHVRELDFPSGTRKVYRTKFPDEPHCLYDKYTIADLLEQAMFDFVAKYGGNETGVLQNTRLKSNTILEGQIELEEITGEVKE